MAAQDPLEKKGLTKEEREKVLAKIKELEEEKKDWEENGEERNHEEAKKVQQHGSDAYNALVDFKNAVLRLKIKTVQKSIELLQVYLTGQIDISEDSISSLRNKITGTQKEIERLTFEGAYLEDEKARIKEIRGLLGYE